MRFSKITNNLSAGRLTLMALVAVLLLIPPASVSVARQKPIRTPVVADCRLSPPGQGFYYHGVHPGGGNGEEDDITSLDAYESSVGPQSGKPKKVAWVYFSHEWAKNGRDNSAFPIDAVRTTSARNSIPFIRLMIRSTTKENRCDGNNNENKYSLRIILEDRAFQQALVRWGNAARDFNKPLIVEWGTEMNGCWFYWNGLWNGREQGPALFKKAFRHIVTTVRDRCGAQYHLGLSR